MPCALPSAVASVAASGPATEAVSAASPSEAASAALLPDSWKHTREALGLAASRGGSGEVIKSHQLGLGLPPSCSKACEIRLARCQTCTRHWCVGNSTLAPGVDGANQADTGTAVRHMRQQPTSPGICHTAPPSHLLLTLSGGSSSWVYSDLLLPRDDCRGLVPVCAAPLLAELLLPPAASAAACSLLSAALLGGPLSSGISASFCGGQQGLM